MARGSESKQYLIVNPDVGGGKTTFAQIMKRALEDQGAEVDVFRFSQGNSLTRVVRAGINAWYRKAAKPGFWQNTFYGGGARSNDGIVSRVLNWEALHKAKKEGKEIVSVSSTAARGADHRHSIMGDVPPEVSASDPQTTAYVTLPESKERLLAEGDQRAVHIAGFLVPDILREQDKKRRNERLDKFDKGEPTTEDPLRLTFISTGQYQHLDYLKEHVLDDPIIKQWIQEGKVKLAVSLWKSKWKARDVYHHATDLGLDAEVTSEYNSESKKGVQILFNRNPDIAAQTSFEMANDTDILLTILAEKVGWTKYVPTIALGAPEINKNMVENTLWAQYTRLVGPASEANNLGQTIRDQLADPYSRLRNYDVIGEAVRLDVANQVKDNSFDVFDGANNIARTIRAETR